MKARAQGLLGAVFYAVLFLSAHAITARIPLPGDTAFRSIPANLLAVAIGLSVAAALGDRPFHAHRRVRPSSLVYSALLGGGFAAVVLLLMIYVPLPSEWIENYTTHTGTPTDRTIAAWVSALIVAPIAEEVLFRGLLFPSLKRAVSAVPAAILTSILFGAVHGTFLWGMYTFLLSLLAIWVIGHTGSLWAAILFHAAFNVCGQLPAFLPDAWPWLQTVYLWAGAIAFVIGGWLLLRHRH